MKQKAWLGKKGRKEALESKGYLWAVIFVFTFFIAGCKITTNPETEEKREVPFIVVSQECVPEELLELIEQKKQDPFQFTYTDKEERYVVVGYGRQKKGGYSIYVKSFYATENALYVDTCLMGPKEKKETKEVPSYPVIILKIKEVGIPVVFE